MGLAIGMVGVGSFAQSFIPLFQAHPLVERMVLCDLDPDKLRANAEKHRIRETSPSLDALCETNVDAVAVITQNWLHAPQAIQALRAGKHVYSAVPTGITLEEIRTLVQTVENTGRVYMIGETSTYYPGVLFCQNQFRDGRFGHVVYAEAEYYHDWDHGLYDVFKWRGGKDWKRLAGSPPMHYVTHSTSQIIAVTGAHMTQVSCQGFVDRVDDGIYQADVNLWGNVFSNEAALFRMSDGSACRINEFRRVGHPGAVRMSLWGTAGSFEQNAAGAVWVTKDGRETMRLEDVLACRGIPAGPDGRMHQGVCSLHPVQRLPREFIGLSNGHAGSHQFLVDDFLQACASGKQPAMNHVWDAARYAIPGVIAHESAARGGVLLDVPDFGDGPARAAN